METERGFIVRILLVLEIGIFTNTEGLKRFPHVFFFFFRDRPKSKMFEVIRNLGDEAFSFKFEGSALLDKLIGGRHGIFLSEVLFQKLSAFFHSFS